MDYSKNCRALMSALFLFIVLLGSGIASAWGAVHPAEPTSAEAISGQFSAIWVDDFKHPENSTVRHFITDDAGQEIELDISEDILRQHRGIRGLSGRRVTVTVEVPITSPPGLETAPPAAHKRKVLSIKLEPAPSSGLGAAVTADSSSGTITQLLAAVTGSQPYISILCRFQDLPNDTPHDVPYYEGLMGTSYPGMDHFWREVSYEKINLVGSRVIGWYNMPGTRLDYLKNGQADLGRLIKDCTAVADNGVYFPDYQGINLIFNSSLECCNNGASYGGSWNLRRDGVNKTYGVTWMLTSHDSFTLAHEMGHSFGLPHSSGPYGETYDSHWDVMSGGFVHTISYHKDILGWIPPAQKYVAMEGSPQTITLERLAQPTSTANYLMAEIPIGGGKFYTAEARRFAGYDSNVPGEAVVLHEVDPARANQAQVVDLNVDGNGNVNDAGAMWTPGESFADPAHGIIMTVNGDTGTGYTVTITKAAAVPTATTNPASNVTATSATLNGTVIPAGQPTTAWFEWGLSTAYGNATPAQDVGSGTSDVSFSAAITGLSPSTEHHFHAVAQSALGIVYGADVIFITPSRSDLIVTDLIGPAQAVMGSTISVTITVKNQGADGTAPFWNGIYLSDRTDLTGWKIPLDSRNVPDGLAAGASHTDTFSNLYISSFSQTGNLYLVGMADNNSSIRETDETNNTMARPIVITAPDLIVTAVSGPTGATPGSVIAGSVQVQNVGTAATPSGFNVSLYLSTNSTLGGGFCCAYSLGAVSTSVLNPGESQTIYYSKQVPATIARGTYYVAATADEPNMIMESNEGNNTKTGNKIRIR